MALIQAGFTSSCLERTVQFNAIVPLDRTSPLFESPDLPLKTLYLLHGYTGSATDWFLNTELGDLATQHGLAIILPDAENHFYVDDRARGDLYGEFIGRELVEFTRRVFPLSRKRDDTIIGGISMGGYGALRNGMKYSGVFGHVIAISPAIIIQELAGATDEPNHVGATRGFYESVFGDLDKAAESDVDLHWLANSLHRAGKEFPDIYIACGYNDMLVYESRRLDGHLTALGVRHTYMEGHGSHEPAFFNTYLRHALELLPLDRPKALPNPFWVER
jgi:S-formylglutathione hydrolase FrmB